MLPFVRLAGKQTFIFILFGIFLLDTEEYFLTHGSLENESFVHWHGLPILNLTCIDRLGSLSESKYYYWYRIFCIVLCALGYWPHLSGPYFVFKRSCPGHLPE